MSTLSRSRATSRRANSNRLCLEPLEERELLSTCVVNGLGDTGAGSGAAGDLRYCIIRANANVAPDTVTFSVNGTVNLIKALPKLASDIDIQGPGFGLLTLQRNTGGDYRIFTVTAGSVVNISGLTITNGHPPQETSGGGILNAGNLALGDIKLTKNLVTTVGGYVEGGGILNLLSGVLKIADSTIADNDALGEGMFSGGWGSGGGIANYGSLSVLRSTIDVNRAGAPGGLGDGGGVLNIGNATISESTINGNVAISNSGDTWGGGIAMWGGLLEIKNSTVSGNSQIVGFGGGGGGGIYVNGGTTSITNSTITANSAKQGGGIWRDFGTLQMHNTMLAENGSGDLKGSFTSSGHNLIGNSNGGSGFHHTDILDVDPFLGSLATTADQLEHMPSSPAAPPSTLATTQTPPNSTNAAPAIHAL